MALQSARSISWAGRMGTLPKKLTFLARSACCSITIAKARDGCEHLVRCSGKSGIVTSLTAWSQLNLGGPSTRNIFHMYWATSFADKSKLDHHYRGLDLNQLTICPIIASLPLKLNILGSSPIKMKYILTTSHSCFHKGQSKMYS